MKKIILAFIFCLTSSICAFSQKAELIDGIGSVNCETYLAFAEKTMIEQTNNPNAKTYIFVYEGKELIPVYKNGKFIKDKSVLPKIGLATAKIQSMKARIKRAKISLDNFVFVKGGFRENFMVEIWSVPNGAKPPKSTPTLKKMKYGKGKAKGFCLGCCG